jgi:endogenous inhibitor of DNA gyrase (YacG/DUF329 family)
MTERTLFVCRTCGAPIASAAKRRKRRFCSDACRQRWCRQRQRKRAEAVSHVKSM